MIIGYTTWYPPVPDVFPSLKRHKNIPAESKDMVQIIGFQLIKPERLVL